MRFCRFFICVASRPETSRRHWRRCWARMRRTRRRAVISRLTADWQGEYGHWQKRDLSARRYLYVWADGVFLQAQMEDLRKVMTEDHLP
jgi:hypothetical protein